MKQTFIATTLTNRLILTVLLLTSLIAVSHAQTVTWELRPGDYSEITYIQKNLFKVVKNGKVGLIRANGDIVAEAIKDSISGYHNGRAVLVRTVGNRMQITGCLTEKGEYYPFTKKYYRVAKRRGFPFFSENLMIVQNENGHAGYIDEIGTPVLGFKANFASLHPFVEGYAVVNIDNKNVLIDKRGNPQTLRLPKVGEINKIFSAYKGLVYLTDANGNLYTYDIHKKGVCERTNLSYERLRVDYLYRIKNISGGSVRASFKAMNYSGVKGPTPISRSSKYGFELGLITLLPTQLDEVTSFNDNYSIVKLEGKRGILKYLPKDKHFAASKPDKAIDFFKGETVKCKLNLIIPNAWKDKSLSYCIELPNGRCVFVDSKDSSIFFEYTPLRSGTEYFNISIEAEGLTLYNDTVPFHFIQRERCATCGQDTRYCSYKGQHPVKKEEQKQKKVTQQPKKENTDVKKKQVPARKDNQEEKTCPECGKKISECNMQGVH